jgi:predicted nucleotidyltransferase
VTGSANQPTHPARNHFSPSERQRVLGRLLDALRQDPQLTGVLVVGSGAEGFDDAYSDIDLCVVLARAEEVRPAFQAWGVRFQQLLPVFYAGESARGPGSTLWVLLLDNFLEIDAGFLSLDALEARWGRWHTVVDRVGQIEPQMQRSRAHRSGPHLPLVYERLVGWTWHYVIHATVAAQRGQAWQALYELEQIRQRTIVLRGTRAGVETKRYRHVDRLPAAFLADVQRTLVADLSRPARMRAIRQATACFYDEARQWDELLGRDLAHRFDRKLQEYLAFFE